MKRRMIAWLAATALTLAGTAALAKDGREDHHEKHGGHHGVAAPAPSAEILAKGKAVYAKTCFACHDTGVAGAPKLGDKAAWRHHIEEGIGHLLEAVLHGKGAMPPRGGNADLSDEELKAAVAYMMEQGR